VALGCLCEIFGASPLSSFATTFAAASSGQQRRIAPVHTIAREKFSRAAIDVSAHVAAVHHPRALCEQKPLRWGFAPQKFFAIQRRPIIYLKFD
jgi:hypothetical protein